MPITSVLRGQIRPLAGYRIKGIPLVFLEPPVGEQIREIITGIMEGD